jgi:outer membrane protein TolC
MKRWRVAIFWLGVLCLAMAGCGPATCLADPELRRALRVPDNVTTPDADLPPVTPSPEPATVNDPEREPYPLSLREAFAVALEYGTIGVQSNRLQGVANDDLVQFTGQGITGSDSVRVLALNPAYYGANIESALSRFDAVWTAGMSWSSTDEPTQGLVTFQNGQAANFYTGLAKILPTGGMAGITFTTDYRNLVTPPTGEFGVLNPAYGTRVLLGFEQPLLRGSGVEVNQLLGGPPGSTLFPGLNGRRGTSEGILLTRLRFDQSRAEFQRAVHFLLVNVETAYWNLYGAYAGLFAADQALRQAYEAWRVSKHKFDEGKIDLGDFAPARAQYEQFRGDRLQALDSVLDSERTLRALLGLPVNDGKRLVPLDSPTLAPFRPLWDAALRDALNLRPELVLAREEIRARQLNRLAQVNSLQPDLRLTATYSAVGLGNRLDGNGNLIDSFGNPAPNNALRSLASNHFNDWTLGLSLNLPLGLRQEHATVRQANLQLAQAYLTLRDQENKARNFLARQYGQLLKAHELIAIRRAQRLANAEQVRVRSNKFAAGQITIDFLLDAQRSWANSISAEYQAIVEYNNTIARFEFARGRILEHDNVTIAEGPLPGCAEERAVEHERERSKAIVLRERLDTDFPPLLHLRDPAPAAQLPPLPAVPVAKLLGPVTPAEAEPVQALPPPAGGAQLGQPTPHEGAPEPAEARLGLPVPEN